eukprot:3216844-Pyramimonas_sp.AAC.1
MRHAHAIAVSSDPDRMSTVSSDTIGASASTLASSCARVAATSAHYREGGLIMPPPPSLRRGG